jgi:hypothetical protein
MAALNVYVTGEGIFLSRGAASSNEVYAFHLGVDGRLKFSQKGA